MQKLPITVQEEILSVSIKDFAAALTSEAFVPGGANHVRVFRESLAGDWIWAGTVSPDGDSSLEIYENTVFSGSRLFLAQVQTNRSARDFVSIDVAVPFEGPYLVDTGVKEIGSGKETE